MPLASIRSLKTLTPLLFVFLWSTGFIGAKFGLPYASPMSFLLVRYLLVIALMLLIALAFRASWPKKASQSGHIAASGILLHPTSLPGPHGCGDCGAEAYRFVDWLVTAGQTLWQILPLSGIGAGNSPYMSSSAFAGNLLFVDLFELQAQGWLRAHELEPVAGLADDRVDYATVLAFRMPRLAQAAQRFFELPAQDERHALFAAFCAGHADWLDDYALFMALDEALALPEWCSWPSALAPGRQATSPLAGTPPA